MKTFKVDVLDSNNKKLQSVFVTANQRTKAERIAIVTTADSFNTKTGELSAKSEMIDKIDLNDLNKYCVKVAILNEEIENPE